MFRWIGPWFCRQEYKIDFFFENNAGELRVIVLSVKENNQERLQSLTATTANQKISHHTYNETTTTTGRT
jgi:hypothetical protein